MYFCCVDEKQGDCSYSENEKKYGFRPVLYSIEEAIEKNKTMFENKGQKAWNQREYQTLLLIQNYLIEHNLKEAYLKEANLEDNNLND